MIRKPHTTPQTIVIDQVQEKSHGECNLVGCDWQSRPSNRRKNTLAAIEQHKRECQHA